MSNDQPANATPEPARIPCPHCGTTIYVVGLQETAQAAGTSHQPQQTQSSNPSGARALFSRLRQRFTMLQPVQDTETEHPALAIPHNRLRIALLVLAFVTIAALLIWRGGPHLSGEMPTPSLAAATAAVPPAQPERDAILATLASYNQAETQAAARLDITPLLPYLEPGSPLLQRRTIQLEERRRRNAPHETALQRWSVGDITIQGANATAVTQETWSNREGGEVGPREATIRATYTLHRDAAGHWLIADTRQEFL